MRWYIVMHPRTGQSWRPFVIAASPDEGWAEDSAATWHDAVALSREEAMLDEDFREAVLEFEAGDDRRHAEYRLEEETDQTLGDALIATATEGLDREGDSEAYMSALRAAVEESLPYPRNQPEEEQDWRNRMFHAGMTAWLTIEEGDRLKDGLGRAMAYDLAVQLKGYVENHGHVPIV